MELLKLRRFFCGSAYISLVHQNEVLCGNGLIYVYTVFPKGFFHNTITTLDGKVFYKSAVFLKVLVLTGQER